MGWGYPARNCEWSYGRFCALYCRMNCDFVILLFLFMLASDGIN
ncbi:hypothetical protein BCN_2221 [Bacillus cereus NC7401]|nr:hypothetical protein BCN_2221 [Bacillus cereus NC7401]